MHLIGLVRLGRDAEVKYTPSGAVLASFSGAFNHGRKDERLTQWVEFAMWGERAEKLAPYLTKGAQVMIAASEPHVETYDKRDGGTGVKLVARVDSLEFAGSRADREAGGERDAQPEPRPQGAKAKAPAAADQFHDLNDDPPF
ncbi:MAG: single-stranded DNA-binding protein [bacterium]|jgi:single-strand DNA-binding protein